MDDEKGDRQDIINKVFTNEMLKYIDAKIQSPGARNESNYETRLEINKYAVYVIFTCLNFRDDSAYKAIFKRTCETIHKNEIKVDDETMKLAKNFLGIYG